MLGRQELEAELLEDTPGALWSHGSIEASRLRSAPAMTRVVVAIDPAVTFGEEADETGIDHRLRDAPGALVFANDLIKKCRRQVGAIAGAAGHDADRVTHQIADQFRGPRGIARRRRGGDGASCEWR